MSWDVVHSRRPVKHGKLPMSCYDIEGDFTQVYSDISPVHYDIQVGMLCRAHRTLELVATYMTRGEL